MFTSLGQQALLGMIVNLCFIVITWWALQALNFEKLLRTNKVIQARVLFILLTITIGSTVSRFFLDYLGFADRLSYLFNS